MPRRLEVDHPAEASGHPRDGGGGFAGPSRPDEIAGEQAGEGACPTGTLPRPDDQRGTIRGRDGRGQKGSGRKKGSVRLADFLALFGKKPDFVVKKTVDVASDDQYAGLTSEERRKLKLRENLRKWKSRNRGWVNLQRRRYYRKTGK